MAIDSLPPAASLFELAPHLPAADASDLLAPAGSNHDPFVLAGATENFGDMLAHLPPGVVIPLVAAGGIALGGAAGYYLQQWRNRRITAAKEFEAKEAVADEPTERTLSHEAKTLVLGSLFANVSIAQGGSSRKTISATLQGKRRYADEVSMVPDKDGVVSLKGPDRTYMPHIITDEFDSFLLRWIYKKYVNDLGLTFVDQKDAMHLRVVVPKGTDLIIKDVVGSVNATGNFGNLTARSAADQKMAFDRIRSAGLSVGTAGRVTINNMAGNLDANVGYNGRLAIAAGSIRGAKLDIGTIGQATIDADTHDPTITCGYNARAKLAYATGNVAITTATIAQTHIRDGQAASVSIDAGYNSRATFGGITASASVSQATIAQTRLGEVTNQLGVNAGYNSRVTVEQGNIQDVSIELQTLAILRAGGSIQSGNITVGYNSLVEAAGYGEDVRVYGSNQGRVKVR